MKAITKLAFAGYHQTQLEVIVQIYTSCDKSCHKVILQATQNTTRMFEAHLRLSRRALKGGTEFTINVLLYYNVWLS